MIGNWKNNLHHFSRLLILIILSEEGTATNHKLPPTHTALTKHFLWLNGEILKEVTTVIKNTVSSNTRKVFHAQGQQKRKDDHGNNEC